MLRWSFSLDPKCRDQRLEIRFQGVYFRKEFLREMANEEDRQAGRQAGLSDDSMQETQVSQWSRKQKGEVLKVLHTRQTKHNET